LGGRAFGHLAPSGSVGVVEGRLELAVDAPCRLGCEVLGDVAMFALLDPLAH
jgi:hypothetical protein